MSDQFTEISTQGFGSRLLGGMVASLIGFLLVPAALVLLYWNEGRAVEAIRALDRGAASVVEANAAAVDPQLDGKLVHLTGLVQAARPAADPEFGVTGERLLRLARNVEMYQWQEQTTSQSQQSLGGSKTTETTYSYQRVWSAQPINSAAFKVQDNHRNPPMPVRAATFDAEATLGAYHVEPSVLEKLSAFQPLATPGAPPAGYQAAPGGFYRGADPGAPRIGDVRVSFSAIPAQTVSIVAAQSGARLAVYRDLSGYGIAVAQPGVASAEALFQGAKKSESRLTWILRGVGCLLLLIGFLCLAAPLTTLFAVVPFLGDLVGAGASLVAITFAVPLALLTIGIAWIAHRPLIGGGLVLAAVAVLALLRRRRPRRLAA